MQDSSKINQDLMAEISALKQKIRELEQSAAKSRRTEKALRENEEKYRFLTENMADVSFMVDMDLRTIYASPSSEKILGFTPEERKTQHIGEKISPQSLQMVIKIMAEEMEREKAGADPDRSRTLELDCYHKDGSIKCLETNIRGIRDSKGALTGFYGLSRDITDRKKAEEAYRNAELRYRTLFEQSPNGILLIDSETGKIIDANETAHRQLGYTREEFTALEVSGYEAVEAPEEITKLIQQVIRDGSDDFETRHRTKSGEIRNVRVWAKTVQLSDRIFFYAIYQDITNRKEAENEILEKSKALEELNTALKVLIAHHKNDQSEFEERVVSNIRVRVIPYIEKLKQTRLDINQTAFLEIIERSFRDISSPFLKLISSEHFRFTPKEVEIVSLIKEGKTTKEIAQILGIGKRTVDSYRDSIRSKLDLANKKVNLRTYLLSIRNT